MRQAAILLSSVRAASDVSSLFVLCACITVQLQGNYNTFETVRGEQLKNQKRAYEADKAKREHMQVHTQCELLYFQVFDSSKW
jgi:hypothetical protein